MVIPPLNSCIIPQGLEKGNTDKSTVIFLQSVCRWLVLRFKTDLPANSKNKFCKIKNLKNESDVEQFFVIRLLNDLGYEDDFIRTKTEIAPTFIGKGRKRREYVPDYIVYIDEEQSEPVLIIDAKSPDVDAEEGVSDAQLYTNIIRRDLSLPKPDQYCIGTNGIRFVVRHYDSNQTEHDLSFLDFQDGNDKFDSLREHISFSSLLQKKHQPIVDGIVFKRVDPDKLRNILEACHKLIWKTEKSSPSATFYEFAKLMFIKLNEDKKMHQTPGLKRLIDSGRPVPLDQVDFSVYWIEKQEKSDRHPVDTILFKNLRNLLERQIQAGKKKRIFEPDEKIDLEPSTVKEVVRILQEYDFISIDEDLNGRLFETFLSATMRGEELGQYFTPRRVVKFMVKMANLEAGKEHIDYILDACCGTGGFLIEAMANLTDTVQKNTSLSNKERDEILGRLRNEHIFGIDAGKSPPIARIARINMFLHGDGGSKIYYADALDKELQVEEGIDEEVRRDRLELQKLLVDEELKFDMVLTNPPFSMKYERNKPHESRILEQYKIALKSGKKRELRSSLRSAVMFIERYHGLLKPNGKLLTIMDESILNTVSAKPFRDYIRSKFIVKAVISLPRNTFVKADSSVKTPVLYLRKKTDSTETQPNVFMAISSNMGHNDTGRETPEECDLDQILRAFRVFDSGG